MHKIKTSKHRNSKSQSLKDVKHSTESRTIFNHFHKPTEFMEACINSVNENATSKAKRLVQEGQRAWENFEFDDKYNKLYNDVAKQIKKKLLTRGFTTKMLYGTPEFTNVNTGMLSKQRAMMGKRDCYFKSAQIDDGNLFHDIYINMSYPWSIKQSTIDEKSMALYALAKELSRLVKIRVQVVNWVGTDTPTCYSYPVKQFGMPIDPKEFLFFTSHSKRTFGWSTYDIICKNNNDSQVFHPENTVPLYQLQLDNVIDSVWAKVQHKYSIKH